jgi:hypothetical protein
VSDEQLPDSSKVVLTNFETETRYVARPRFVMEPDFLWLRSRASSDVFNSPGSPGNPNGWSRDSWTNWGTTITSPGHTVHGLLRQSGPYGGADGGQWWTRTLAFGPYVDFPGGASYFCDFKVLVDFRNVADTASPAVRLDLTENAGAILDEAELSASQVAQPVGWVKWRLKIRGTHSHHPRVEARVFHRNGIGSVWFAQAVFGQDM